MKIEFGELRIGDIARKHINDCLDRNWVTSGPKMVQFESEWGALFDYKFNVAVSSGTDACINLCMGLYEFGANPGDEVIVPALSFIATTNAVVAAGLKPVFVDIDRATLNINPDLIERSITDKTKAIFCVHTMGRPCNMHAILEIAKKHNLIVLEDCCEAHGALYHGGRIGTFGHGGAFSFYIAHLVCCGEGGMVSTNIFDMAQSVASTRSHGRQPGSLYFNHIRAGINSKMTDIEASIGLEGISNFNDTFNKRHDNMMTLHDALDKYKYLFYTSEQDEGCINCAHAFSITMKNKYYAEKLRNYLTECGINWKRNFGCIPTQHTAFAKYDNFGCSFGDFPDAEFVGTNGIHFGVHQYLTDSDINYIIDKLSAFFEEVA